MDGINEFVAWCGIIITVSGAVSIICNTIKKMNEPNRQISENKEKIKQLEQKITSLEGTLGMTAEMVYALLEHETTGNNQKGLEELTTKYANHFIHINQK